MENLAPESLADCGGGKDFNWPPACFKDGESRQEQESVVEEKDYLELDKQAGGVC